MLTIREGHANGTMSPTSPHEQTGPQPVIDARDRWVWSGVEPAIEGIPPPGSEAEAGGGVPWLWRLLSCVASGWEERSGLLRLAATTAERPVRARALNALGRFAWQAGELGGARSFFHEALVLGRALHDGASVTASLSGLAAVAVAGGAYDLARSLHEEALSIRRKLGDLDGSARDLAALGWLAAERGDHVQARACFEESLAMRRGLDARSAIAISLLHLGWFEYLRHDHGAARRLLGESLALAWDRADRWKLVALLGVLGRPPLVGTMVEQAARLLIGAEALDEPGAFGEAGEVNPARQPGEPGGRLSARELAEAWMDGHGASVDALVEHALRAAPPFAARGGGRADAREVLVLSPREREVATLVGRGYTNHRIADELVITERTAETHVRNIREKLGFATRAQVAAWAADHGLLDRPEAG